VNNAGQHHRDNVADILTEIESFARLGSDAISLDDQARLRRYGFYTQRPVEDGFFMVRIRIPGGDISPAQVETIADLADHHGRGVVDITVRQNMQLHWVRTQGFPDIVDRLSAVGLSTTEVCGDTARNIVNCPVAGVDERELYDTTGIISEISALLAGNPQFYGLPRKLKITLTGCHLLCVYPEISDIGIFAVRDKRSSKPVFRARVGGGLSTSPRFGRDLGVLIQPRDVVEACAAISSVFRDRALGQADYGDHPCFTVAESDVDDFRGLVETKLGWALERTDATEAGPAANRDRSHSGIHRQKTGGLYYISLSILAGRISGSDLRLLAHLAMQYGGGRIRTTNSQNIILLDIPEENLAGLSGDLKLAGFDYEPSWVRREMLACTGIQFCKLALTETKNRVALLGRELEEQIDLDEPIRISVTGCPNSCGQHHICDVGLEGSLTTVDGIKREAFQVFLGGGVGSYESFGRRVGVRVPADHLAEALTGLFTRYKTFRNQRESFQDFCRRHSDADLAGFLRPAT